MNQHAPNARRARGFSLVELMVALVAGLIVTGATITVFLSTSRTYGTAESLGRVQENLRVAYELMSRDMREAAGNPCEKNLPRYNVLKNPASLWYTDFTAGIRGYEGTEAFPGSAFGTATAQRIAGTDAIELKSAMAGVSIVSHNPTSAQFKVGTVDHGLSNGDVVLACDFAQVAVFQVTNAQPGINNTIVHNNGTGTPGNCSKGLGFSSPVNCTTNGNQYAYGCYRGKFAGGGCDGDDDGIKNEAEDVWPAIIARMRMTRWYVGANGNGGRSLYQSSLRNNAGALVVDNNEIVEGVRDMGLQYLLAGAGGYVDASAVTVADWASDRVVAVRLDLTLQADQPAVADQIQRHLQLIVTIRNHAQ
ncbi:PilW family protein [Lysobacter solisilvae (ex Woo and Kim 2020)]|uniref:PilW family protein n=1 Tax=Agrilutibacter terrestris TaxID=2865112 RepID=A0A7H0G175_9GAMM|nr:PilW family protein [Lysobacter terrestris]QNP42041.1 PilW family protein [Lysobacter terrestris]